MFPYIIMFAHFVISTAVILFVYKELAKLDKLKINLSQNLISSLLLTVPTFVVSTVAPGMWGVLIGAIALFFFQKSYVKDNKTNLLLVLKTSAILVLVIVLILFASVLILR